MPCICSFSNGRVMKQKGENKTDLDNWIFSQNGRRIRNYEALLASAAG